jgi:FkbM family methyltransferase
MSLLKRIASQLPNPLQQEMKRMRFARQLSKNTFTTEEPEFKRLSEWVGAGDWVLDIGANVGHYACRLSELVGLNGRVFAFEPMPATFELLAANAARFQHPNVTLLNVAASDTSGIVGMQVPHFDSGLSNYYMANISSTEADMSVVCMEIDALRITHPVRFAKLDVEGHELSALKGMRAVLERFHPVMIIEGASQEVADYLTQFGYSFKYEKGSPNRVFEVRV